MKILIFFKLFLPIFFILFSSFLFIKNADYQADERAHYMTISELASGDITKDTFSRNAQIPTYYYLMSIFKRINSSLDIGDLRALQMLFSLVTIFFVYLIAREIDEKHTIIKTLQILVFPLLHIFLVLVYNESLTLLFTLLSFLFLLKKNYSWSWIAVFISISLRQNNIIWILFLLIYQGQELISNQLTRESILQYFNKTWGYVFSIVFVVLFLIINKGPALADAHANPLALHVENIYFLLWLLPVLFLPSILYSGSSMLKIVKNKPWILIIIPILFICYWYFFKADNFFNSEHYIFHLRNRVLHQMLSSYLSKILYFIPIIIGLFWLLVERLIDRRYYAIYVFTIIYLALLWLVEPRYYLIPIVFFLLFRKINNKKLEVIQLLYFAILSAINIWGSVNFRFFL